MWRYVTDRFRRDPIRRAAWRLVHDDVRHVPERVAEYLHATPDVRQVAKMLLAERVEMHAGTNSVPTFAGLLTAIATVGAVLMGIYLSVFNFLVTSVGSVNGPTAQQLQDGTRLMIEPVGAIAAVLLAIPIAAWLNAKTRDRERAAAVAWVGVYREAEERASI